MNFNKRLINISLLVCLSLMFCFVQGSDNETMLQELEIENALQEKLSTMIENKLLNESEYVLIVNATMRKKPLSTSSTSDNSSNTQATFTLPGFPLKNLQENKSDNTIVSNDSDYLLYFLEIVAYIDGDKINPKLKVDLRKLIIEGVPDIRDCEDCIRIEQMEFNVKSPKSSEIAKLESQIETLKTDYDEAQKQIINWQFDRLEEQLAITQDALAEKESKEEERVTEAKLNLERQLAELEAIKIQYYAGKDEQIDKQEAKIAHLDQKNEERLDFLIKGQTEKPEQPINEMPTSEDPWYKSIMLWVIIGIVVFIVLIAILILVFKKNKKPIYLKPVHPTPPQTNNGGGVQQQSATTVNESNDVVRSELNSLRQSAVSMSVGQKEGATQIVQDWLEVDGEQNTENQEQ